MKTLVLQSHLLCQLFWQVLDQIGLLFVQTSGHTGYHLPSTIDRSREREGGKGHLVNTSSDLVKGALIITIVRLPDFCLSLLQKFVQ